MKYAIRCFLMIFEAALLSALVGAMLVGTMGTLLPEFNGWFDWRVKVAPIVGAVCGFFFGAGAMTFALAVSALTQWFRRDPQEKK